MKQGISCSKPGKKTKECATSSLTETMASLSWKICRQRQVSATFRNQSSGVFKFRDFILGSDDRGNDIISTSCCSIKWIAKHERSVKGPGEGEWKGEGSVM